MKLKELLNHPCGFAGLFSRMEIGSAYARACLLATEMMTGCEPLRAAYRELEAYRDAVSLPENRLAVELLSQKLQSLKDIHTTLDRLGGGETLDDIEWYEVKYLGMLSIEVRVLLEKLHLAEITVVPDLEKVVQTLDPDGLHIATFYVYDSYSEELAQLRAESRRSAVFDEELFLKINALEEWIRARLSASLRGESATLREAQQILAQTDILLAKARLMLNENFSIPEFYDDGSTEYRQMFHPEVKVALAGEGKNYTLVDIAFGGRPVLIIGANMGGKTVVLKTLALCQFLCQFGFGVPAAQARVALKEEVCFCIGDHQSITEGLSSFASEMRQIDALIRLARQGSKVLALLDEPARTTNPTEGTALVRALLPILSTPQTDVLIATHYVIPFDGKHRCLKVKGLENGSMNYTLTEVNEGEVPLEALNIATQLDVDPEWIREAEKFVK